MTRGCSTKAAVREIVHDFLQARLAMDVSNYQIACVSDEIAAAITALEVADTWQPIETAPKNGTRVLGYRPPFRNRAVIYFAKWCDLRSAWVSTPGDTPNTPTHWQPLPAAPGQGTTP